MDIPPASGPPRDPLETPIEVDLGERHGLHIVPVTSLVDDEDELLVLRHVAVERGHAGVAAGPWP